ncbi:MAG: glycosyltransferase [Thermonemataceae bacterium]|nr:glycosyltransferase [Thermonemataceae bacterium]
MKKHILYISYDGLTDPLGQSQILPYIKGLAQQYDYEFSIISAEKKGNFLQKKEEIYHLLQDLPIAWYPVFYTKKPPIFSTLWDLRKIRQKAIQIFREKPYQVVHSRSYLSALIARGLDKKLAVPFIFDMRGFWADERVDGNLWNLKNPIYHKIYNFFKRKEKEFLQTAAYTISLTHNAKKEIHNWEDCGNVAIQVIPCCVDLEAFALQTPQKNKSLVMSYLGSVGTWYLLKEMLLYYKILLESYPQAEFLFITTEAPEMILTEAQIMGLPTEQIRITKAARNEVPSLLAQTDFSIFFIKDAFSKKASSATKMAEILAMGKPVISNFIGDHQFLAYKYNFGILLNNFEEQSIRDSIKKIPELLQMNPLKLREIAEDYFSLQKGIDLYAEVYEKVLKK